MTGLDGLGVVLVDDHLAMRKGLELLLRQEGLRIAGTAGTAEHALEMVGRRKPDLVVADLALPAASGAWLCRELLERDPRLGVLIYTGLDDTGRLTDAMTCGARGFALKSASPTELLNAIHAVARGDTYVDPGLHRVLLGRETTRHVTVLTSRERECLNLLAEGLTGEGIAERLFLSPETVRTHVRNAMEKLNAQTRTHAIVLALRQGHLKLGNSPI